MKMTLDQLKPGQQAMIQRIPHPRLWMLGLSPGTKVEIISIGPGGTPYHLYFYGCSLLMDRETAKQIEVKL